MADNENKFTPDIQGLLDDLSGPDYFTNVYSDIGIDSLIVLNGVFRVDKSYLGNYLGRTLFQNRQIYEKKKTLDLGSGCGLLGLICAMNGATSVHFADINKVAVKNCKLNATLLDLNNCSYSDGNLFDGIPNDEKFEIIVFNPPSISGVPINSSEAALVREDHIISDFYNQLSQYLADGGQVIMPGSTRFDGPMSPLNMAQKFNLDVQMIDKQYEDDGNYKYVVSLTKRNEI
jgi:methylase of polypeptide subunit release factors